MAKRSNYERIAQDKYPTPEKPVLRLLKHLPAGVKFVEPCAGDGQLVDILEKYGFQCGWKSDIEPQKKGIKKIDALDLVNLLTQGNCIITNPPWEKRPWCGEIFNKLLRHWLKTFVGDPAMATHGDIWLLFDADWLHTKQSAEFLPYIKKVVTVGRVKWFPGTKHAAKDNCAWYCFNANNVPAKDGTIKFYGRLW